MYISLSNHSNLHQCAKQEKETVLILDCYFNEGGQYRLKHVIQRSMKLGQFSILWHFKLKIGMALLQQQSVYVVLPGTIKGFFCP